LRDLGVELFVQGFVGGLGGGGFGFEAGQLVRVFVGLFDEFADLVRGMNRLGQVREPEAEIFGCIENVPLSVERRSRGVYDCAS
jgi:hypothetical protein